MFGFLRDLAFAIRSKGFNVVKDAIPFATPLVEIVADALQRRKARHEQAALKEDIAAIARIESRDEAQRVAAEIAREVVDRGPLEIQLQLENYLTQVPQALRQSLRRPEDPSGKTVGARFDESPEHIAQMLPQRLPRFQAGDKPDCLRGEWVLKELLGTGGFGEVWKARHADFDGTVAAIKFCLDPAAQDRLLKHEGQLINQVMKHGSHPGIVPLLDASLRTNPPWLRYEYIRGGDLLLVFNKLKPLSIADRLKTALPFFQKLCEAVGFFHRLNPPVVHRDLKPSNILMMKTPGGYKLRISDFGISQLAARHTLENADASTPNLSMAGTLHGAHSLLYSSPQQRKGEPADVRDDVYSLGVILYQLLMADPMAERPGGLDWADELREGGVPEEIVKLIGMCVADRVEKRPSDGGKVRETLPVIQVERPNTRESAGKVPETSRAEQTGIELPPGIPDTRRKLTEEQKAGVVPQSLDLVEQQKEFRKGLMLKELAPLKIGSRFTNEIGMEFTWIPPGQFLMGSPKGVGDDDERPQHKITIAQGFFMGVFPVTQEQWQRVMGDNPSINKMVKRPVECVFWKDCQEFLSKLRELDARTYRLPSEAEWECACRAGTTTQYFFGDNDASLGEFAWFKSNAHGLTEQVGQKKANPWGLHDILGNVWEWCEDWYSPYDESLTDGRAQTIKRSSGGRIVRGGSCCNNPITCRVATRDECRGCRDSVGLRVVFRADS